MIEKNSFGEITSWCLEVKASGRMKKVFGKAGLL